MAGNGAIDAVNRTQAASGELYVANPLNIEQGVVGATLGVVKKNIFETVLAAVGLDLNVSKGYEDIMSNPNNAIEARGRMYYPHTAIGDMRPYNEAGNPSKGCFSLYTMG